MPSLGTRTNAEDEREEITRRLAGTVGAGQFLAELVLEAETKDDLDAAKRVARRYLGRADRCFGQTTERTDNDGNRAVPMSQIVAGIVGP